MNLYFRLTVLVTSILLCLKTISAEGYDLPTLPPMPSVSAPLTPNSIPMGDPSNFAEVKMDFPIETNGPFLPNWTSISNNLPTDVDALRQAKFGIWVHYGPQASGMSGDWYAQHMYQQGSLAYSNHLEMFGHPITNGYKDVVHLWNPTNYDPAALAHIYYNAGARFVLVQGVHHDNFDNWNSKYNQWNIMNFGAKRDTMAEWFKAARSLNMRIGVAFHHEYSWWFYAPAYGADASGPLAGVPYDAVTDTNGTGTWWQNYDLRRLYNINLNEYQAVKNQNLSGGWSPDQGIFSNHLDYAHWYATQWALRILDVIEQYDPDFIYTDGDSTQPFSGYYTGTGYKCDAMQRVIAHLENRAVERHGKADVFSVVKFHPGDRVVTTYEGLYPSGIVNNQPWMADTAVGDWFYRNGFTYDSGMVIHELLECVSRDGAACICISLRPDGSLDSGSRSMLQQIGQWMTINGEGIYG
ncbi:MAG TPA: alpha-L-fucosidase, partial [Candidatus Acidoferrum sp.]|nr:alpha-L-fucosidase [Candidatus Acidoferrum sp.]